MAALHPLQISILALTQPEDIQGQGAWRGAFFFLTKQFPIHQGENRPVNSVRKECQIHGTLRSTMAQRLADTDLPRARAARRKYSICSVANVKKCKGWLRNSCTSGRN